MTGASGAGKTALVKMVAEGMEKDERVLSRALSAQLVRRSRSAQCFADLEEVKNAQARSTSTARSTPTSGYRR